MALITLAQLKSAWDNVSNWVKGIDAVSSPKITISSPLPSGTNNIGKVGIDQTAQGETNGVSIKGNANYESNEVDVVSE